MFTTVRKLWAQADIIHSTKQQLKLRQDLKIETEKLVEKELASVGKEWGSTSPRRERNKNKKASKRRTQYNERIRRSIDRRLLNLDGIQILSFEITGYIL